MEVRLPIESNRYVSVVVAWYVSVVVTGLAVAALAVWLAPANADVFIVLVEALVSFVTVVGVVAPVVVGLMLRRMKDPAAGMTVSALMMLGHILLIGGPAILTTPFVARWLAIRRHQSGGF